MSDDTSNPINNFIASIYYLKVHLLGISPKIYRRFMVSGNTNLFQLHHILQVVMGWKDIHLNSFHIWGVDYGVYHLGGQSFKDDPWKISLNSLGLKNGDTFGYRYDFGDNWEHEIRVERMEVAKPDTSYPPTVTFGKRACPPEDCGGAVAYQSQLAEQSCWLQETLSDIYYTVKQGNLPTLNFDNVPYWFSKHDPEVYDKERVNKVLGKLYQKNGDQDFWLKLSDYEAFLQGS